MDEMIINSETMLFCDYYKQWIMVYKEGAIRPITMQKYYMAYRWLEKLVPKLQIQHLDRISYQKILNQYASVHERQTTMDFHHHLKCAILDAVDEGLIPRDPTRKAIIKGKQPREKKPKFLNQYELHKLLDDLDLKSEINMDWLILLIAKTGLRFSEALALTPKDFDLTKMLESFNSKIFNLKFFLCFNIIINGVIVTWLSIKPNMNQCLTNFPNWMIYCVCDWLVKGFTITHDSCGGINL